MAATLLPSSQQVGNHNKLKTHHSKAQNPFCCSCFYIKPVKQYLLYLSVSEKCKLNPYSQFVYWFLILVTRLKRLNTIE